MTAPISVTLYDAQYGTNENIIIDPIVNWDGSNNGYSDLTFEPYLYYQNDMFNLGDDVLYDINEGVLHGVQFDQFGAPMVDFAGDPMFIDFSTDFVPPAPVATTPVSVTLYDAQYGTNENIIIDPIVNWDGSNNGYSDLTFEPYLYYQNDMFNLGDDVLYDINEGVLHGVQFDQFGAPMVDFAGDPMFIDYTVDFI